MPSLPSLCRRGREAEAGPLQEGRQTPPQRATCPSKATLDEHGQHRATRKRLCFHSQPHRVCASVRPCGALKTCQRLPPCPHCCSVERAAAIELNFASVGPKSARRGCAVRGCAVLTLSASGALRSDTCASSLDCWPFGTAMSGPYSFGVIGLRISSIASTALLHATSTRPPASARCLTWSASSHAVYILACVRTYMLDMARSLACIRTFTHQLARHLQSAYL